MRSPGGSVGSLIVSGGQSKARSSVRVTHSSGTLKIKPSSSSTPIDFTIVSEDAKEWVERWRKTLQMSGA